MKHVLEDTPRRNALYPGESSGEFQAAFEKATDKIRFIATRLIRNGWNAESERQFQYHAHKIAAGLKDNEELIEALKWAETDERERKQRAEEARIKATKKAQEQPPEIKEQDLEFEQTRL